MRPKRRLPALSSFVHKGAPMGPGLILGCPTCSEVTRPIWLTQVVFFRGADVLKFTASHKWNSNSHPNLVQPSEVHRRHSLASIFLWGPNGNAPQPNPIPSSRICKWDHSSLPQIGDLVSTDQQFGLSLEHSGFKGMPFDGVLGLNYPNFSFTGGTPIFDNLKNQGAIPEPVLAFYLSK